MADGTVAMRERILNAAFGLSALSWAILGLRHDGMCAARLCLSALHLNVAILFLVRAPLVAAGGAWQLAAALPSLVLSGLLLRWASPLADWPLAAELMFAAAAIWALSALTKLGRNFAVLPARRSLVTGGVYAVVRHPAYLGELVLAAVCAGVVADVRAATAVVALVPAIVWRIRAEETLLTADPAYAEYQARVRWRLLPRIW
jgi:protein-S-isoprenylcysteine O-methyltransferase Ste14